MVVVTGTQLTTNPLFLRVCREKLNCSKEVFDDLFDYKDIESEVQSDVNHEKVSSYFTYHTDFCFLIPARRGPDG